MGLTRNEVSERAAAIWGTYTDLNQSLSGSGNWIVVVHQVIHFLDPHGHTTCHRECHSLEMKAYPPPGRPADRMVPVNERGVSLNALAFEDINEGVVCEFRTARTKSGKIAWRCFYYTTEEFNAFEQRGYGYTPVQAFLTLCELEEDRKDSPTLKLVHSEVREAFGDPAPMIYRIVCWAYEPDGVKTIVDLIEVKHDHMLAEHYLKGYRERAANKNDALYRAVVTMESHPDE